MRHVFELKKLSRIDLPPLIDFIDAHLRLDWHLPPKQLRELLDRESSEVWAITASEAIVGFAIVYDGLKLHNLFIAPAYRFLGLGAMVVESLQPETVRAKCNMSMGDPVPFYEKQGYRIVAKDAAKPHILIMKKLRV